MPPPPRSTRPYTLFPSTTLFRSHGYLGIAAALAVVAAAVWLFRNRLKGERHEVSSLADGIALLKRRRFGLGALCIFLYVGAEVAIGSFLVNYLAQPHVLDLSDAEAGKLLSFYWGGALAGRFVGSGLQIGRAPV